MSNAEALLNRIDAEFESAKQKVQEFQQEKLAEYHQREERLATFAKVCDELREIWKPRLDALIERFGERAAVTPTISRTLRAAVFHVQSPMAKVELTLSALPDAEVRNFVLQYNLEILPILMKFKNSDRLEMPLDKIDKQAVGNWIDDRIVDFVKTYLDLHQNQQYLGYLKHYTVEDPITGAKFPKYAAGAKCDWNGQTYYFLGEETCQEFRKRHGISI